MGGLVATVATASVVGADPSGGHAFAHAVELHAVIRELEAVGVRDLLLERLDLVVLELDDAVARGADQVVVVLVVAGLRGLVLGGTVAEVVLVRDAGVHEQLHGPVDRRVADARVELPRLREQLVDGDVLLPGQERLEDRLPLSRQLEALAPHVVGQAVVGCCVVGMHASS